MFVDPEDCDASGSVFGGLVSEAPENEYPSTTRKRIEIKSYSHTNSQLLCAFGLIISWCTSDYASDAALSGESRVNLTSSIRSQEMRDDESVSLRILMTLPFFPARPVLPAT